MRLTDAQYERACADGAVSHLNVGCGKDQTIRELAEMVGKALKYDGEVLWDSSKPDGMLRKWLDTSRLSSLGWDSRIGLEVGIMNAYEWHKSAKTL
jgi:GDP-L-fucose synthase